MTRERPLIVGPEQVAAPYPMTVESKVVAGYGRGSAELNCPTANIEQAAFDQLQLETTGVYYGWASVHVNRNVSDRKEAVSTKADEDQEQDQVKVRRHTQQNFGDELGSDEGVVFPMVMSVGYNPFYGNKKKTGEIHIIHKYSSPFYGAHIKFTILGYIRPEYDYVSKEALMEDIQMDIRVALQSLERQDYQKFKKLAQ